MNLNNSRHGILPSIMGTAPMPTVFVVRHSSSSFERIMAHRTRGVHFEYLPIYMPIPKQVVGGRVRININQ